MMLATAALVRAEPALQLDIVGGTYVGGREDSTVTSSDIFQLVALLSPNSRRAPTSADTFYIGISLVPRTKTAGDLGSFVFNGTTVDATADLVYGTPSGLPRHGQFPNFYAEFTFTFDLNNKCLTYNAATTIGPSPGPTADSSGQSFFNLFDVDTSGLADGVELHFDLYRKKANGRVDKFAPFSHDAETVPEPGAFVMTGIGLLLFALIRRRMA